MKRFFNNLFYKTYRVFLILSGLFLFFIYGLMIIAYIDKLMFADEAVAAVKFTFSKLLFWPLAAFLAYLSVLVVMYIVNTVRIHAFVKPDKALIFKHAGLFVLIVAATFIAMQFNTVLYTDGSINSNNLIERFSPEYTENDYDKVTFYGESVGSSVPNRAPHIHFQFYMVFFIDEDTYVQFYSEEFRDYGTVYKFKETLGEKLEILPEEGFPANIAANMSQGQYELYQMMYRDLQVSEEIDDITEDETEQEHYAFDGVYVF